MQKVVLNIPHSSTFVPKWAMKSITVSETELDSLMDFMTDKDVDKIWGFVPMQNKVAAGVSRIIVDTERYRNDEDEAMFSKGMGLYYTHTPFGKEFRVRNGDDYLKCLKIYDKYHLSLEKKVADCVEKHGKCIILDCHSFHDEMYYTDYEPSGFPDVCIGINESITPEAELIINIFKSYGYSVKVNEPFAGSLTPLKFLNDARVTSIMIELNRRIYLGSSFAEVQDLCKKIYAALCKL